MTRIFLFLLLLASCTTAPVHAQDIARGATSDGIRNAIETGRAFGLITTTEGNIRSYTGLTTFYDRNAYAPVWNAARMTALLDALQKASGHALDPGDYRLASLTARAAAGVFDVETELLATDAYMLYGSHLHEGRINPLTLEAEWTANRRTSKMELILEEALRANDITASLERLAPQQARYAALKARYAELSEMAAETTPLIPAGPSMKEGDRGPRIAALRLRLLDDGAGDGPEDGPEDADVFDATLKEAVLAFQARYGLDADGVVGPATLSALNRTPEERRAMIAANMERWRWLPDSLGRHHIEVNLAGFELTVVRDGEIQRRHRVVVGRAYRETPMFSGTMTYLVLAPYWNLPPTIASQDKFPQIKADPGYVAANRMVLFDQSTGASVDPFAVDFSSMTGREFNQRFRLRQEPGPSNALGNVKFMFPNRHHVYLHDTPTRELFSRSFRGFSSGCVRVENPLELTNYLLADDPAWTPKRVLDTIGGGKETSVILKEKIPVHLLYWTVWVDENGELQFREDLYGRDAKVLAALAEAPSGR